MKNYIVFFLSTTYLINCKKNWQSFSLVLPTYAKKVPRMQQTGLIKLPIILTYTKNEPSSAFFSFNFGLFQTNNKNLKTNLRETISIQYLALGIKLMPFRLWVSSINQCSRPHLYNVLPFIYYHLLSLRKCSWTFAQAFVAFLYLISTSFATREIVQLINVF